MLVSSEICKFSDLATSEFHVQVHFVSGSFLVIIIIEKKGRGNVVKQKKKNVAQMGNTLTLFPRNSVRKENRPPSASRRLEGDRARQFLSLVLKCLRPRVLVRGTLLLLYYK